MDSKNVNIIIDGQSISTRSGMRLLDAAREHGIDIPSLCYKKHMLPLDSCRMCVVRVKGLAGLKSSCSLVVEEGMDICSMDDEIEAVRRTTLELILADHDYDCSICHQAGECTLQDLAYRYQIDAQGCRDFRAVEDRPVVEPDVTSPVLEFDPGKCIRCGICIQACSELQGKHVLDFMDRGMQVFPSPEYWTWKESSCDGCGECVQNCPTAALTEKPVNGRFRISDIDKRVRTSCGYCGVGCQMDLWVRNNQVVKVRGAGADVLPNRGRLCVKGRFGYQFLGSRERLRVPLIRKKGTFCEVSWEEALDYTAQKLAEIRDESGPDSLAGLASARCTNEENYIFQKFFRAAVGTNSVDHCARLCHAPTVAGLVRAFGSGAMTNPIEDLAGADCILVTGANVSETHPVTATYIRNARDRGAQIIVIDPRKIDLIQGSTLWLRPKSGTDVAWINGLIHIILEEGLADREFIRTRTDNFVALEEAVKPFTPRVVEDISGISEKQLRQAARLYGAASKSSIVFAMGITQHITGTDNVLSLANLAMVCGQVGRASTGVNPLRGQNNVQGACDMGGLPNVFPGYQHVSDPEIRLKFETAWGRAPLAAKTGLTVMEMMNSASEGRVRGMMIMGENPMLSDPNLNHVEASLKALDFLVVQDIFMTETSALADVILPAAAFAEKEGSFTNTGRRVLRVRKAVEPPGESRADWQILTEISTRMGYPMAYKNSSQIMKEIASLTPIYGGISYERLEDENLQWPCPSQEHPGTPFLHKEQFSRGKGLFHPVDYIPPAERPDKEYPFVLSTGRLLYHYHTATMTRRSEALNDFAPSAYGEINGEDLDRLGAGEGDLLKVTSRRGEIVVPARKSDRVAPGVLFIPFHFHESPVNRLTNDALDPASKIPELKVSACRVELV
ncbi:formate dehydrogenase subunit alpha [Oceanispirochaeta crateris]|uniref:Formate dehydrogenase subunit alpha n=1 Tax=Oceanispirochaeta crateris TaxID=2518645 RepID=A0A5C1QJ63_9SPIO|nr:formate dehydrogenase subunit alpha [Oceanispirochaeta crateris]QEN06614.1 formate dehydrogenase subunit alpha [Oceanispirochaeta crateris]